ncbi:hypothetical protein AKO1_013476 [Acrasis kona]|uniref:Gustatory receptor n=1 Tax=Acrasis kona TaxID=1008807 RepID=A0AAW2ZJR8_9EUKA
MQKEWPEKYLPLKEEVKDMINKRYGYFLILLLCVAVNFVLFIIKLGNDFNRDKFVKVRIAEYGKVDKFVRIVCSVFFTLCSTGLCVLYINQAISSNRDYRLGLWYTSVSLFAIFLFFNLVYMNAYVHKAVGGYLEKYVCKNKNTDPESPRGCKYYELSSDMSDSSVEEIVNKIEEDKNGKLVFRPWVYYMFLIGNYFIRSLWMVTLSILAWSCGYVISRLIECTVVNGLINTQMITTYSFFITLLSVFYNFYDDIEKPYMKLKNAIVRERGSLGFDRILPYRRWISGVDIAEIRDNMTVAKDTAYAYLIPMTWTVFFRISKLMRVGEATSRSFLQMVFVIFILCVVYFANLIYNTRLALSLSGNSTLLAIVVSTVLPLISTIFTNLTQRESGTDNLYTSRLGNCLRLLERQEENRNKIEFKAGNIPFKWIPFKYIALSTVGESKKEVMDPLYEYDDATNTAKALNDDIANHKKNN